MADIISKKTRYEFREYLVSYTLREIENEFDAADVTFDKNYKPDLSGQRRTFVEQYYHSVDWSKWRDVRKVISVYENILTNIENSIERYSDGSTGSESYITSAKSSLMSLSKWLKKDGFEYQDGKLITAGKNINFEKLEDVTGSFGAIELKRQLDRMQQSIEDDPGLAIGTSKELLETTCKTILNEHEIQYNDNEDLIKLVKKTRKTLGLVPDNIPNAAKGADTIRRLLNNLATVAQGITELRNLYGTGHGKDGKARGLSARHARLAVGAAATLATFFLETHEERNRSFETCCNKGRGKK